VATSVSVTGVFVAEELQEKSVAVSATATINFVIILKVKHLYNKPNKKG
jgi:hypothetical protein